MSTTKPHTRIFAFLGALLFLITSCALTGAVLWQIHQDNNKSKTITSTTQDIAKQLKAADAKQQPAAEGANKLQGTKLADFTPVSKIDELQKIDLTEGTGPEVKEGGKVTAHYTGAIAADGTIFQSSHDGGQPIPFSLGQVIEGWKEGVPGMKVGGKRRLLIPAAKAYGANPPPGSNIPSNADLVFDIELTAVQ